MSEGITWVMSHSGARPGCASGAWLSWTVCNDGDWPHPFVPGIDMDDPAHPDPRWCNTCGESRGVRP